VEVDEAAVATLSGELRMVTMAYRLRCAIFALLSFVAAAFRLMRRNRRSAAARSFSASTQATPPTYDCQQSVLFPIIHLLTPHYSNLLKIDTPNYPKIIGESRRELDRGGQCQDLHLQAPCECEVP